jgi:Fe-S cluster assembly iron-binding protein IscA
MNKLPREIDIEKYEIFFKTEDNVEALQEVGLKLLLAFDSLQELVDSQIDYINKLENHIDHLKKLLLI